MPSQILNLKIILKVIKVTVAQNSIGYSLIKEAYKIILFYLLRMKI